MRKSGPRARLWFFLAIALATVTDLAAQVTVTHIANEGFLLEGGGKKVLIDALFDGISGYRKATGDLKRDLEEAKPPFRDVDVILATHFHDDHFSPPPVRRYLAASEKTVFLSTPQACSKLSPSNEMSGRCIAIYPEVGTIVTKRINGVRIEVLNLHHGPGRRPPVQNLGFIVHIGGRRVLHIGDTEASKSDFAPLRLASEPVDLALLPGWFLTTWDRSSPDWVSVVRDEIRPLNVAAMHLASPSAPGSYFGSDGSLEQRVASIRKNFPGAEVFIEPLQRRVY